MNDNLTHRMELNVLEDGLVGLFVDRDRSDLEVRCINERTNFVERGGKMENFTASVKYAGNLFGIARLFGALLAQFRSQLSVYCNYFHD